MSRGRRGNGEGTITQRKNGTFEAKITIEGGKRKSIYGKTRKEVQEKLKIALREQQQGTLVTSPQQKLEVFLKDWLESTQKHSVRPRTYERYEEIVRLHIIPVLGRHYLQKLTAQQVQAFYTKKLDEGLAAKTVENFHIVLHKALDTAVKWNLISRNVCDLVTPPRGEEFEIKPLTVDQIHKLLDVMRGHRSEALFLLALVTGMRRGEIMGLKWQDIDFATSTLQVRRILTRVPTKLRAEGHKEVFVEAEPKTRRSRRSIVIASFALEALKQHRVRQLEVRTKAGALWQDHDYVFCTSIGTHVNPTKDILDPLKALLRKASLPDIRFHDLRHSAGTLLLAMGIHPKIAQELLGHSNISMTMDIYSHVLPGMQQEAISKLNDMLAGLGEEDETTD
ncbi:MAG: tyrosine-type recombinase/integrase [Ktedonobacteraceae bacterium]|nr:tyrosine-type recombinase/integrase [Ktedonobacteraceae bacterium]